MYKLCWSITTTNAVLDIITAISEKQRNFSEQKRPHFQYIPLSMLRRTFPDRWGSKFWKIKSGISITNGEPVSGIACGSNKVGQMGGWDGVINDSCCPGWQRSRDTDVVSDTCTSPVAANVLAERRASFGQEPIGRARRTYPPEQNLIQSI